MHTGTNETRHQKLPADTGAGQHHFMRDMSRPTRSYRLGDLLVAAHLITEAQLGHALSIQRHSKEQLGIILVREGYVSAVQIYRKLAEQWCLRASAAGLTLMMQTFAPSLAHADDAQGRVQVASAFATAAIKPAKPVGSYPRLFGTTEIRSNDVSAFTKWTSVMKRFDSQMHSAAANSPRVEAWKEKIQSLRGKSVREQIDGVNGYLNSVRYIEDTANYGKGDYWATPIEFLSRGGDCEDFAIAKYASLRALGFSSDQMRIAVVQDKIKRVAHAILIVYTDDGAFVLDNQNKRVESAENVTRYQPVFSISSNHWWLHRAAAGA